jgi:hypothetical protein
VGFLADIKENIIAVIVVIKDIIMLIFDLRELIEEFFHNYY